MSQRNNVAFTLVELLIVIGILSLLAAILFPVFSSARKNASKADCLSNLSQIGKAILAYSSDYDDLLPYAAENKGKKFAQSGSSSDTDILLLKSLPDITDTLFPYSKSSEIWRCKQDRIFDANELPDKSSTYFKFCNSSYDYNYLLAFKKRALSRMNYITKLPLVFDSGNNHGGDSGSGMNNCLYGDFHVKTVVNQQRAQELVDSLEEADAGS